MALIDRGIRSVFVGIVDPDPRNNGKGLQLLREAGVHVELGTLEQEIRKFLTPYLLECSQAELANLMAVQPTSGRPALG